MIRKLTPDGSLLFITRIARMFGYGFLSIVLVLYLEKVGLKQVQIGLLLTLTLIGDTIISCGLQQTLTASEGGGCSLPVLS